jgi:hypothetical protein
MVARLRTCPPSRTIIDGNVSGIVLDFGGSDKDET